jgi:hypothetical protein
VLMKTIAWFSSILTLAYATRSSFDVLERLQSSASDPLIGRDVEAMT